MSMVQTTRGRRAARRASRRPQVQHLITADEHSLVELELALSTLPLCAVGRVFIEVPEASDIRDIHVPSRMTVTWLPRVRRRGEPPRAAGASLTGAALAWAGEMLCEGAHTGLRTEAILLGDYLSTADIVEHLTGQCGIEPSAIRTPARYGIFQD